ncbi:MAG: hypothetical protein M0P12_00290 [Paludibacteraceae bacterium]|nr:hypothetical protein [Paludibacteraceae bacterium]
MGNKILLPDGTPLTLTTGEAKDVEDGNHSFGELYEHRILLYMAFIKSLPQDTAWKSLRHSPLNGKEEPMYKDSFISGLNVPGTNQQISYHIPLRYFDICPAKELEHAPLWDSHSSFDVLDRLLEYITRPKKNFDSDFSWDGNPKTWIGFDFDGTLAFYDRIMTIDPLTGKSDPLYIGNPIPKTVELAKDWINMGVEIRIITARVSSLPFLEKSPQEQKVILLIQDWCLKHLGKKLPVSCEKDKNMFCLYDDRTIQLIKNKGTR